VNREQSRPAHLRLPDSWSRPVADLLNRLIAAIESGEAIEAAWRAAIAGAGAALDAMDRKALAAFFEAGLGASAVGGLVSSSRSKPGVGRRASGVTAASADSAAELGIRFAPFAEAAADVAGRRTVAAIARTAEWSGVPAELRRRAFFSAGVESAEWLQGVRGFLQKRLNLEQERLANGLLVWRDRDAFVADARLLADRVGLPLAPDGQVGTLTDIRSLPRLHLVYEVQNQQAAEYARRRADMDPAALDAYPAFFLSRVESRRVPRGEAFWASRWAAAGAVANWDGAKRTPMVALKTSPIWQALGDAGPFGQPYPPFEWGSGMGVIDVSRREAETLGLLRIGDPAPRPEAPLPAFNANLQAQTTVDRDLAAKLQGWFGSQVEISADGTATWTGG
jgi:hypothetical protein